LPTIKGNQVYIGQMPDTNKFYETYASWLNSGRVRLGIGDDYHTIDDVRKLLDEWKNNPDNWTFCIYDSASDQPIGDFCIRYGVEKTSTTAPY